MPVRGVNPEVALYPLKEGWCSSRRLKPSYCGIVGIAEAKIQNALLQAELEIRARRGIPIDRVLFSAAGCAVGAALFFTGYALVAREAARHSSFGSTFGFLLFLVGTAVWICSGWFGVRWGPRLDEEGLALVATKLNEINASLLGTYTSLNICERSYLQSFVTESPELSLGLRSLATYYLVVQLVPPGASAIIPTLDEACRQTSSRSAAAHAVMEMTSRPKAWRIQSQSSELSATLNAPEAAP